MTLVALIPARANSKRIPGKALKPLGGLPLIEWTIVAAKESGVFDRILVCSDDPATLESAARHGIDWFQRNPSHDTEPDIQWVSRVLHDIGSGWEAFAILRPTSPFRSAETIRRAWEQFNRRWRDEQWDSLRAVEAARQHPAKMWRKDKNLLWPLLLQPTGQPWHSSPTQSLPKVYVQTAGLEIAWADTVRQGRTIAGERVLGFEMKWPESLDINTLEDWWLAERVVAEGLVKVPEVEAVAAR